jgi:hypothetical protein
MEGAIWTREMVRIARGETTKRFFARQPSFAVKQYVSRRG